MSQIRNKKELKSVRSSLRRRMPAPELMLWQKLRAKTLGIKFRRQFSIGDYILDFCAPTVGLGIELDGESHFENQESVTADRIRDAQVAKFGIRVLRFTNREVIENLEGVLDRISEYLPPLNLPLRMGEKIKGKTPLARGEG